MRPHIFVLAISSQPAEGGLNIIPFRIFRGNCVDGRLDLKDNKHMRSVLRWLERVLKPAKRLS
jgi:hypothetical protein